MKPFIDRTIKNGECLLEVDSQSIETFIPVVEEVKKIQDDILAFVNVHNWTEVVNKSIEYSNSRSVSIGN